MQTIEIKEGETTTVAGVQITLKSTGTHNQGGAVSKTATIEVAE